MREGGRVRRQRGVHKNVDICMLNATSTSHEVIQANLHVEGKTERLREREGETSDDFLLL